MAIVASGEAALVLTDPPYFPADLELQLFQPRRSQLDPEPIWNRLVEFANSLSDVYREIARVVGNTGIAAIEIKDIRYGEFLLQLSVFAISAKKSHYCFICFLP